MLKQTFVVTLEIPSPFARYFPRVEAERMAKIIHDGVKAKSISFNGPVPFTLRVEKTDEAASASGHMREYRPGEFPEVEEAVRERSKTVEV